MGVQDGEIVGATQIVDNGPANKRWNQVLIAEGYLKSELGTFHSDVNGYVQHLFSSPPFDEPDVQQAINIYRIDVASDESGADDPAPCGGTGAQVATFFDATFCTSGLRRLLTVNTKTVLDVAKEHVSQWHQILVMVNTASWGGSGGLIGTTSTANGWENIALHEMGHAAFGLADEYDYWQSCATDTDRDVYNGPEPAEPNVTINTERQTIKWLGLIQASTPLPTSSNPDCRMCDVQPSPMPPGTVGAFEGGRYFHCGVYRPAFHCMMRNLRQFCPVCQEQIRRTLRPFRA